jgi:hypothetical protein
MSMFLTLSGSDLCTKDPKVQPMRVFLTLFLLMISAIEACLLRESL